MLRQAAYADLDQRTYGENISVILPENNVTASSPAVQFAPHYNANNAPLSDAAYCGYDFLLDAYSGDPIVYLGWETAPALTDLWVGLGNFDRDCWKWFQPGDTAQLDFLENSPYFSESGVFLLEIVVLGDSPCSLNGLSVGIPPTIWKVDDDAAAGGDGLTWETAFDNLQDALAAAWMGDEVWVAAGTYMPGPSREDVFQLGTGIAMYGGFASGENDASERDWEANTTTLSGDIGTPSDDSDNNYTVVAGANRATLDGFAVTGGHSDDFTGDPWGITRCGGGVYNTGMGFTVENCTFVDNKGVVGGGLINRGGITVVDCTFDHNYSYQQGSGVRNVYHMDLTGCTFTGNFGASFGGGLNTTGSGVVNVTGCEFNGNAGGDGGGVYCACNAVFTDCVFTGNTASDNGAGVYVFSALPEFYDCAFTENAGDKTGGGMQLDNGSNALLLRCSFIRNTAPQGGAGLYNWQGSSPYIVDCLFLGNTSTSHGGAITNYYSSNPRLYNCLFCGNTAVYGGAICNRFSENPQVYNSTFCGNQAVNGGAIGNTNESNLTAGNCIFWGNTATNQGPQWYSDNSSALIGGCDIQDCGGSGAGWDGALGSDAGGNIDLDPLYITLPNPGADLVWGTADDDYGNLRLQGGSPCIDAGANMGVPDEITLDLDGNPRKVDDPATADTGLGDPPIVDIGAYEYQP